MTSGATDLPQAQRLDGVDPSVESALRISSCVEEALGCGFARGKVPRRMVVVEKQIEINRPAVDVFAYVSDQTHGPLWQRGLLEVRRTTDGPIGVGTRHTGVRKFVGRTLELSNEYTRYEPNTLVAFKVEGTVPGQGSYVLEEVGGDRTGLTSRVELHASGLSRLAEPFMAMSLRREMKANLAALKDLLEGGGTGGELPTR
jgi:uncharacterized membrane protein